jgi:hypothetical protein
LHSPRPPLLTVLPRGALPPGSDLYPGSDLPVLAAWIARGGTVAPDAVVALGGAQFLGTVADPRSTDAPSLLGALPHGACATASAHAARGEAQPDPLDTHAMDVLVPCAWAVSADEIGAGAAACAGWPLVLSNANAGRNGVWAARDGPKTSRDGPRTSRDGPRTSCDGLKTPRRRPWLRAVGGSWSPRAASATPRCAVLALDGGKTELAVLNFVDPRALTPASAARAGVVHVEDRFVHCTEQILADYDDYDDDDDDDPESDDDGEADDRGEGGNGDDDVNNDDDGACNDDPDGAASGAVDGTAGQTRRAPRRSQSSASSAASYSSSQSQSSRSSERPVPRFIAARAPAAEVRWLMVCVQGSNGRAARLHAKLLRSPAVARLFGDRMLVYAANDSSGFTPALVTGAEPRVAARLRRLGDPGRGAIGAINLGVGATRRVSSVRLGPAWCLGTRVNLPVAATAAAAAAAYPAGCAPLALYTARTDECLSILRTARSSGSVPAGLDAGQVRDFVRRVHARDLRGGELAPGTDVACFFECLFSKLKKIANLPLNAHTTKKKKKKKKNLHIPVHPAL